VPASSVGYPQCSDSCKPAAAWAARRVRDAPFDNDRTVIRGGYGIFYTGIRLSVIRTNLTGQFPFAAQTTYTAVNPSSTVAGSNLDFDHESVSLVGWIAGRHSYAERVRSTRSSANLQSYNLTIEQDLGKGIALEIAYAGSKGTHLAQETDYNQERIPNTASSRPFPVFQAITLEQFNGVSHYDSGQVTVRRRFEHGLFFRLNYTYAKSLILNPALTPPAATGTSATRMC